jgi:hypothetical protein
MRRLLLATALVMSAALFGCGGGSNSPVAPLDNSAQGDDVALEALKAEVDAQGPGYGFFEVVDAETGAVVSTTDLAVNEDGSYGLDLRSAQDIAYGPAANQVFRVALVIDTDAPFAPRGYTGAGNPLYYVGDTVGYDLNITRKFRKRSRLYRLGAFDVEARHIFAADNSLLPECVPGQNPLTIQDVDFKDKTPNGGPYAWSLDGKTFAASGLQFKLCNLPGLQFGTDKICIRIYWVVPGSAFGLPCNTCEVRCIVFDKCIGIYDPPA